MCSGPFVLVLVLVLVLVHTPLFLPSSFLRIRMNELSACVVVSGPFGGGARPLRVRVLRISLSGEGRLDDFPFNKTPNESAPLGLAEPFPQTLKEGVIVSLAPPIDYCE